MNLNLGKFYLLCCCIVPIVLPASDGDLGRRNPFQSTSTTPICPQSSPVSDQASPKIINLSELSGKSFSAKVLSGSSVSHKDIPIGLPLCTKRPSSSKLSEEEIKKLFEGYTPGENTGRSSVLGGSSVCSEAIKASLQKNPRILTIPELIRNSAANRLEKEEQQNIEKKIQASEQKLKTIQKGRYLVKACALATSIALSSLAMKSEPQSRFGVGAAMSIISMLPNVAGGLGAIWIMYKIERAMNYGADVLREDVKRWRGEDSSKIQKQFDLYKDRIDKEIANRIQSDKAIRKESITHLHNEVSELKTKIAKVSSLVEAAEVSVAHARNELLTVAPEVHTASQNTHDLKAFIAKQVFPMIEKIQGQVTAMKTYNEQPDIDPLGDNIEYALNRVYIAPDSDTEHKSSTPPSRMARSNGIKLQPSDIQEPQENVFANFMRTASEFQNQFRRNKKPKK